jgi:uncharacterized protein YbbC (DUF1343 family)
MNQFKAISITIVLIVFSVVSNSSPHTQPPSSEFDDEQLSLIELLVEEAIQQELVCGAVIGVGNREGLVYKKAFGLRNLHQKPEIMTEDTIFDLASLTKPVATASAIWKLVEMGKIRLKDNVADFIPELKTVVKGKKKTENKPIKIEHLLTHTAGLLPYLKIPLDKNLGNPSELEALIKEIANSAIKESPGRSFRYSCLGYILLSHIVQKVSGKNLNEFCQMHIFDPLHMDHTFFVPDKTICPNIAPTELVDNHLLRGIVHDPLARKLGGISGNAGLFSNVNDLSKFAIMILNGGKFKSKRIFSPLTVKAMTSVYPPLRKFGRSPGWDVLTGYSSPRGDLLSLRSFGHTGFTGTSLWIDPETKTFIIILTNRVHPDGKGDVRRLRSLIANIVAASVIHSDQTAVIPGLDVFLAQHLALIKGKRVGLITHPAGINLQLQSTADLFFKHPDINLVALYGPEHGIRGNAQAGEYVPFYMDHKYNLPVFSLYGQTKKPDAAMLKNIDKYMRTFDTTSEGKVPQKKMVNQVDILVCDLQDVGTRVYTYIATMAYALQTCAENEIPFIILDRPNPINGSLMGGPLLRYPQYSSFVGLYPIPLRHGMTIGELAMLFNDLYLPKKAKLTVIPMKNWRRKMWMNETSLKWVMPSPNMPTLSTATVYPGQVLIEGTNLSEARGTTRPFEMVGAPWIDGYDLASNLNELNLAGVGFREAWFTPTFSKYKLQRCGGVQLHITDRQSYRPVETTLHLLNAVIQRYPKKFKFHAVYFDKIMGTPFIRKALKKGLPVETIIEEYQQELLEFEKLRKPYLLYR